MRDKDEGLAEENSLPAVDDRTQVQNIKQYLNCVLVLVWKAVVHGLVNRKFLAQELDMVKCVEGWTRKRGKERYMSQEI